MKTQSGEDLIFCIYLCQLPVGWAVGRVWLSLISH